MGKRWQGIGGGEGRDGQESVEVTQSKYIKSTHETVKEPTELINRVLTQDLYKKK